MEDGVGGNEDAISMIESMGYSKEQAKEALEKNDGNVDDAIDDLFLGRVGKTKPTTQSESTATDPAPVANEVKKEEVQSYSQDATTVARTSSETDETATSLPESTASDEEVAAAPAPVANEVKKEETQSYSPDVAIPIIQDDEATIPSTNRSAAPDTAATVIACSSSETDKTTSSPSKSTASDEEAPPSTDDTMVEDADGGNCWTKSSQKKKRIIVLGALAALLVIVLAIAIPVSRNNNAEPAASSSQPPAPSNDEALGPAPPPQDDQSPSSSPVVIRTEENVSELLSSLSVDDGAALTTVGSPQNQAFQWIMTNANLSEYSDAKLTQRYALATLYYSANGMNWKNAWGWLSDKDECSPSDWYQSQGALEESFCNANGELAVLKLMDNRLDGIFPPEIGMLGESLEILNLSSNKLQGPIPESIRELTGLRK